MNTEYFTPKFLFMYVKKGFLQIQKIHLNLIQNCQLSGCKVPVAVCIFLESPLIYMHDLTSHNPCCKISRIFHSEVSQGLFKSGMAIVLCLFISSYIFQKNCL